MQGFIPLLYIFLNLRNLFFERMIDLSIKNWRIKRIANDIKLKDVAKAIGISDSYLCRYEKGQVQLNRKIVDKYKAYIEEYGNNA